MKIKAIIFDLDGVLVKTKELHFEAFNLALKELNLPVLSIQEHIAFYDGLSTKQKIKKYSEKNIKVSFNPHFLHNKKQFYTDSLLLSYIKNDRPLQEKLLRLKKDGYILGLASNTIRDTIIKIKELLGIENLFDCTYGNQDVYMPKPHPEIYWKAMTHLRVSPEEVLIVEDSPIGIQAAQRSGANVMIVKNPDEVTYERVKNHIGRLENSLIPKDFYEDNTLNVLIPMAGAGSRFEKAGYSFPKPLISVQNFNGKPMIQLVTESLKIKANYIYVVQKEHLEKYNLDTILNIITPGCKIVTIEGITDGAARTILKAKELINNENPLFICNSDQFLDWNPNDFFYKVNNQEVDGGIVTFENTHPKWSYVLEGDNGSISKVVEKQVVSKKATTGHYFYKKGSNCVKYIESMIEKDIRHNGEFYFAPSFNLAIQDGKRILPYDVPTEKFWGLGTPEDLEFFTENYKK